jgi:outer membrane protein assembly factor BamB/citrate lyase synthetase
MKTCFSLICLLFGFGFLASGQEPGDVIWEFQIGGWVESSPAIGSNGTIYIGAGEKRKVYALNGKTGAIIWEFDTGQSVDSTPAIGSDGTVYIGSGEWSGDGKVFALDGVTGDKIWEFIVGGYVESSPAIGSDGTVYIGAGDGKVYALNPNGVKKWTFNTGNEIESSPAIGSDGTVYIGSADGKVYAIKPNGTKKWASNAGEEVGSSPAIGSDGTVYIGGSDGVYALNGKSGTRKWKFNVGSYWESSPAIGSDGTIYIGSGDHEIGNGKVYALNPNGTKKWEFEVEGSVESCAAIGNDGTVYIGSGGGKVYALDGKSGAKKWELKTDWVESSPAIGSDGTVYIGGGKVYAIKSSSSGPANSPWPMFSQNNQRTGRKMPAPAPAPPVITTHPIPQTVDAGASVTFSVAATGTAPLSYRWFKNNVHLGFGSNELVLTNVKQSDTGSYKVVVSNDAGQVTSSSVQLTVKSKIKSDLRFSVLDNNTVTITDCEESATGDLVIPSTYEGKPVTSIGNFAFFDCSSLTSVRIPDSVTSIGYAAFSGAASIGDDWAVEGCISLTSIEVGKGNTEYSSEDGVLFNENKTVLIQFPAGKSGHYTIPDSVTSIEDSAFYYCSSLTSVTIPDSVTSIGVYPFLGCSSLTSIEVGKGNTKYSSEDGVLFDKNKTELIQFPLGKQSGHYSIPDSVTSIGGYAFSGVGRSLASVRIPDSVTTIGEWAFYGSRALTGVTIGNSVTSIGDHAFGNCSGLTSVRIPDSVTSIGSVTFSGCSGLTSVTIGNSVTSIGGSTFGNCSSLTSVTIGNSVTSIGIFAFWGCNSLTSITFKGNAPSFLPFIENSPFPFHVYEDAKIFVNSSATGFGETFAGVPVQILEKTKITLQPKNQIVEFGDSAEFVLGASGTEPLEYQWYKDGQQIAGATETIYRIVSVSQGDPGIYSVRVQNKLGRAYSQTVELSLAQLHTLTVASRDPDSGITVTVSPADHNGQAGGTTPFTRVYLNGTEVTLSAKQSVGANQFKQWLKNGEPVGTDPTVTVTMDYDRTLRAVYEPKPVTLTVASRDPDSGITVTLSPADQNGQADGTTQFTRVYSEGTEVTLTAVQSAGVNQFKGWLKNGEPAGTEPTVTVTMDYDRTLRAVYEPIPVTLTVASRDPDSGITVTVSPADQIGQSDGTTQFTRVYSKGTEVTLSAKQSAAGNQFKQWLGNGVSIGTEPTVTVTMDYDRTLRAVYEVGIKSPVITTHPISQIVDAGASVTFSVAATGTQPLSYRWRRNGGFLGPATESPTLTLGNVQPEQGGTYRVVVSNAAGTVMSGAAELGVKETLHTLTVASRDPDSGMMVTISPADQNGHSDGTTQFTRVYAKGTEVMLSAMQTVGVNQFKQWLKNGISIGTEPTVTVTMDYDRTLRAVYEVGIQSPVITTHPIPQIVDAGASVTFSVAATGTQPLSYRWRRNGVFLGPATESPTLTFGNVQPEQGGTYRVMVSNAAGTVMSGAAELGVKETLHTLTVASRDPDSGMMVTISPADQNGHSDGTTQFTRVYAKGTEVMLSAKQTVGVNQFKQWLGNGVPVGTQPTVTVTMDYNRTLRAVYEPKQEVILTFETTKMNSKGNLILKAKGPVNSKVTYQFTYDLINWQDQFTLPMTNGESTITLPVPKTGQDSQFFYRLKLVE